MGACARHPTRRPTDSRVTRAAPDSFHVRLETSRGPVVLKLHRDWSPLAVDRFHALVRTGFYDDARMFRVVAGFVAQWGIPASPELAKPWEGKTIADESVRRSNVRGTVSFARGGPNSRTAQVYVNLADNVRLDTLNRFGFPVIGYVIEGMATFDSLYAGYGGTRAQRLPGPSQDSIRQQGNAYLMRAFPRLDYIRTARVTRQWR